MPQRPLPAAPCKNSALLAKLKLAGFFSLCFLGLFTAARFALLKTASNYFAPLSTHDTIFSFLIGLRFDIYIFALLVCPFFLILFLPVISRLLFKIIAISLCILFAVTALFLAADNIFFSIFNNHIGVELFTAFTHAGLFIQLAFQTYWYITFPLIIVLVGAVLLTNRYCNRLALQRPPHFICKSVALCLGLAFLMLLGVRSRLSFHGKALEVVASQALGSQQSADLILNSVFYFAHAVRTNQHRKVFFPENSRPLSIATKAEVVLDENYPFERQRTAFNLENKGYNFVLLLLESFDPVVLDKHAPAAPNLNRIKSQSLYFKNFYASGSRSLMAVTATLLSIPYVWGIPTFTQGLGGKNLSRLASYFKQKGYGTVNVITDRSSPDRAIEMAGYVGFDNFYSKEDIPLHHNYPAFNKGFDEEGLEFFLDKLNQISGNFFGYFFSSSTHAPYDIVLSEELAPYPNDGEENQFLNRVVYSDHALGNFFEKARQHPWFNKTIFFILPDHRATFLNKKQEDNKARQNYQSFLLIYAPAIFKPATIDLLATQEDILPTLVDMLNSTEPFASSGQSILDPDRSPIKYIYSENNLIYILRPEGYHAFALADDISSLSDEEKQAVYFNETLYRGLKENKFIKK